MTKTSKLNQIIVVEKQQKSALNTQSAELHKQNQKADSFMGMVRVYEKLNEEDKESLPSESKKVQASAEENLKEWGKLLGEYVNTVATKDQGNAEASATLKATGDVKLPVTLLVWLEKQLIDHRTFVNNLPTLDPSRDWHYDTNQGIYATDVVKTSRSKKVPKVIVKAEATQYHPAQAEIHNEDILAGYWNTQLLSGAVTVPRKRELLARVEALISEVKVAREEANMTHVTPSLVGSAIIDYLIK